MKLLYCPQGQDVGAKGSILAALAKKPASSVDETNLFGVLLVTSLQPDENDHLEEPGRPKRKRQ